MSIELENRLVVGQAHLSSAEETQCIHMYVHISCASDQDLTCSSDIRNTATNTSRDSFGVTTSALGHDTISVSVGIPFFAIIQNPDCTRLKISVKK